jgi:FimV-like protein
MAVWLWLCLVGAQCQALTLGDLAVSSHPSPNFIASVPLMDDSGIRVSDLMTRVATDAEYAQWGLQAPQVLRELLFRIVPTSQSVAYLELYSTSTLSQSSFDLLVWASYAGQTSLTSYKVQLQDLPSLIKGKTLYTSPSKGWRPTQARAPLKDNPKPSPPTHSALTGQAKTVTPADGVIQSTAASTWAPQERTTDIVRTQVARPLPKMTPETPQKQAHPTDDTSGIAGLAVVFSLVLFCFGFLVGRLRNTKAKTPGHSALPPQSLSALAIRGTSPAIIPSPALWPQSKTGSQKVPPVSSGSLDKQAFIFQPIASETAKPQQPPIPVTESKSQTIIETSTAQEIEIVSAKTAQQSPDAVVIVEKNAHDHDHAQYDVQVLVEPIKVEPANSVGMGLRTPATALPTPGLQTFGTSRKVRKARSTETENIDLAKIYLSMGDPATARLLLEQACDNGSDTEKALAHQLLRSIK